VLGAASEVGSSGDLVDSVHGTYFASDYNRFTLLSSDLVSIHSPLPSITPSPSQFLLKLHSDRPDDVIPRVGNTGEVKAFYMPVLMRATVFRHSLEAHRLDREMH
jgi:hypothetical protein